MLHNCSVIIVSYNNAPYVAKCMESLQHQTMPPTQIILVDTGSQDRSFLELYKDKADIILGEPECGFCVGNNLGYQSVHSNAHTVLFLNPDAFLFPDFIENAHHFLERDEEAGALTGLTLGYDFDQQKPTGLIDTTGILSTWYGKWYDRDQGTPYTPKEQSIPHSLPAICGAVFFARKKALDSVLIKGEVMDSSFYMYKEDIDLSLRLKKKGWQLMYVPLLKAYHCRGWSPNRKKMARKYRLCSAYNELRINTRRRCLTGSFYSFSKYLAVKVFNC
jgi:N-acetylglucosaminyl-diphospho-decaprenol L-rhamnosyltransferase